MRDIRDIAPRAGDETDSMNRASDVEQPTEMEINRAVGRALRAHRLTRGYSQGMLGRAVGVTFQLIQRYEKGTTRLPLSRMVTLTGALNIDPANFLRDVMLELHMEGRRPDHGHDPNTLLFMRLFRDLDPPVQRRIKALVATLRR